MPLDALIKQATYLIKQAKAIVVLTGAGVSKESGVPTFRDAMEGLWSRYNPEELATPHAFQANPKLVWDWYQQRRELARQVAPNPGHLAIARLQDIRPSVHIVTQNVDDLHEQAGSHDVIHLHGNIASNRCFADCQGFPTLIDIKALDYEEDAGPPECPHCGALIRPNVVWFTEILPRKELTTAVEFCERCDVMLVVGTSGLVSPAADLPHLAKRSNAKVIEVNPDYSMITPLADIKLAGASGEVLPRVIEELNAL